MMRVALRSLLSGTIILGDTDCCNATGTSIIIWTEFFTIGGQVCGSSLWVNGERERFNWSRSRLMTKFTTTSLLCGSRLIRLRQGHLIVCVTDCTGWPMIP